MNQRQNNYRNFEPFLDKTKYRKLNSRFSQKNSGKGKYRINFQIAPTTCFPIFAGMQWNTYRIVGGINPAAVGNPEHLLSSFVF